MTDKDKIETFGDLVDASEKITRPWRKLAVWLIAALVASNLIWGFVHWYHIRVAYLTPVEMEQGQQFDEHTQSQRYSEGATGGN